MRTSHSTSPSGPSSVAVAAVEEAQPTSVVPPASRSADPAKTAKRPSTWWFSTTEASIVSSSRARPRMRVTGRWTTGPSGSDWSTHRGVERSQLPLSNIRIVPSGCWKAVCCAHGPVPSGSSGKVKSLCRPPRRHTMSPEANPSCGVRATLRTALRWRKDSSRSPSSMTWMELRWA